VKPSLRILYVSDQRYYFCAGKWYTNNGLPLAVYEAWLAGGTVEQWTIFGRLEWRTSPPAGAIQLQAAGQVPVKVIGPVRSQHGIRGYLRNASTYLRILRAAVKEHNVVWVKANFVAGWFTIPFLCKTNARRLAISHQVGDPGGLAMGPKGALRGMRALGAVCTSWVHRVCDVNVFVSRDLAGKYGNPKAITLIANESRVNRSDLIRPESLRATVRDPLRIVYVGRLSREKRVDVLLTALSRLRIGFTLSIVGDGLLRDELVQMARRLGIEDAVTFVGAVEWGPALFGVLREHDVLVLPSSTEGLPLVLVEAMSQGVLVIGTRVGGIPELVEHQSTGLLVEPGNAESLSAAITECATSPESGLLMRQRALEKAEANTVENQAGRMFSLLGKLARNRGLLLNETSSNVESGQARIHS
jgi:glycosyltransferase involved in cell wall biosynthesis